MNEEVVVEVEAEADSKDNNLVQQQPISSDPLPVRFKIRPKCPKCSCGKIEKWTIFRFGVIFIGAILILCIIYGLKSAQSEKDSSR